MQEKAVIGLLIDQRALAAAQTRAIDALGPPVSVAPDPEQGLAVIGPDEVAGALVGQHGDVLAGLQVADAQLVIFRTARIHGPGQIAVIGAVRDIAGVEIFNALGLRVAVQQDLLIAGRGLRGGIDGTARKDRILAAFAVAHEIFERTVGQGRGGIILLDAALHFLEQGFLEVPGGRHDGVQIGVLGVQMLADLRLQDGRVLHYGLPVVVAQPGIIIGARAAQLLGLKRLLAGAGRDGGARGVKNRVGHGGFQSDGRLNGRPFSMVIMV